MRHLLPRLFLSALLQHLEHEPSGGRRFWDLNYIKIDITMELTENQEMLIDGLKAFGVHKEQVIPMMVALKDNEDGMMELMEYMATYQPTAHEIIKKSIEIVVKCNQNKE